MPGANPEKVLDVDEVFASAIGAHGLRPVPHGEPLGPESTKMISYDGGEHEAKVDRLSMLPNEVFARIVSALADGSQDRWIESAKNIHALGMTSRTSREKVLSVPHIGDALQGLEKTGEAVGSVCAEFEKMCSSDFREQYRQYYSGILTWDEQFDADIGYLAAIIGKNLRFIDSSGHSASIGQAMRLDEYPRTNVIEAWLPYLTEFSEDNARRLISGTCTTLVETDSGYVAQKIVAALEVEKCLHVPEVDDAVRELQHVEREDPSRLTRFKLELVSQGRKNSRAARPGDELGAAVAALAEDFTDDQVRSMVVGAIGRALDSGFAGGRRALAAAVRNRDGGRSA